MESKLGHYVAMWVLWPVIIEHECKTCSLKVTFLPGRRDQRRMLQQSTWREPSRVRRWHGTPNNCSWSLVVSFETPVLIFQESRLTLSVSDTNTLPFLSSPSNVRSDSNASMLVSNPSEYEQDSAHLIGVTSLFLVGVTGALVTAAGWIWKVDLEGLLRYSTLLDQVAESVWKIQKSLQVGVVEALSNLSFLWTHPFRERIRLWYHLYAVLISLFIWIGTDLTEMTSSSL